MIETRYNISQLHFPLLEERARVRYMLMKHILLLIILCLCFTIQGYSKLKVTGYFIGKNHDTVYVTFLAPIRFFSGDVNYEKIQDGIKYLTKSGKKLKLKPDSVLEFSVTFDWEKVRYVSCPNNLYLGSIFSESKKIFLKLEVDGYLKLFRYYFTRSSGPMYNGVSGGWSGGYSYQDDSYIYRKGEGDLFKPRGLWFKKDMIEYLADDPVLVKKISEKDYRGRDAKSIVHEYNYNKKKKETP